MSSTSSRPTLPHPEFKIVRGTYLTAVGQENKDYYFKVAVNHSFFETIKKDDICMTFLERDNLVTSVPAIVRIDCVVSRYYPVQKFLRREKETGCPLLPIISVFDDFDFDKFILLRKEWENYSEEIVKITEEKRAKLYQGKNDERWEQVDLFDLPY